MIRVIAAAAPVPCVRPPVGTKTASAANARSHIQAGTETLISFCEASACTVTPDGCAILPGTGSGSQCVARLVPPQPEGLATLREAADRDVQQRVNAQGNEVPEPAQQAQDTNLQRKDTVSDVTITHTGASGNLNEGQR